MKQILTNGYVVRRTEHLKYLDGTYIELTHRRTGARHVHVACGDDNNAFCALFPTVPKDSTGIAHILEHLVLQGSERFPVKDPFFAMIPRSLSTFMNALTFPDATAYPFSTRNLKDFYNLLDVYLDAVFFPKMSEPSFKQDGHHLEFEDPEDLSTPLVIKGVVFNEMKGAMAEPARAMWRAIGQNLFPDLTYAHNSGGSPEEIPNLEYEATKRFHATHYHPSNGFFYSYGTLDLETLLRRLDQTLSRFEPIEIDTAIPDQKNFTAPVEVTEPYPLAPEEDPARRSQALIAWKTALVTDSFEVLALNVCESVLLGNAASPLRKALMDSGLGETLADGAGFDTGYRESVFAAGLKGIAQHDAPKVFEIVHSMLQRVVEEGVDPKKVDAAIHQLEIDSREINHRPYPYGLKLFFNLSGAYVRGGDPYRSVQFDEDVARLQEERGKGRFFEDLIRKWLVDNPHHVRVLLVPDQNLDRQKSEEERAKLAAVRRRMTEHQAARIVEDTRALKARHEAKQDLSVLPTLELSDIPMTFEDVGHSIEEIGGARVGFFPQPTNGLTYIDIRADFSALPGRLKDRLPVFSYVLTRSGAGKFDYAEMAGRIDSYTGGVHAGPGIRVSPGQIFQNFTLSGMALQRNHRPFIEILTDIATGAVFTADRTKELIAEQKSHSESSVIGAGHHYAAQLAASQLSPAGALRERLGGLAQLTLLKELASMNTGQVDDLIAGLQAIADHLFRSPGLNICITSEESSFEELRDSIKEMLEAFSSAPRPPAPPEPPSPAALGPQARTTSVPVAYNAKAIATVPFTHPDSPALLVLSEYLSDKFLLKELREKAGAYGAFATADRESGLLTFGTYRDPQIAKSFETFDRAAEHAITNNIAPEDLREAILAACRAVDPLHSPDSKARTRFFDDLAGYTLNLKSTYKAKLLEVTPEDLRRVAAQYLKAPGAIATITNSKMAEEANAQMGSILTIAPI
jgi:presequence protease